MMVAMAVLRQHVVFDPSPVFNGLIAYNARRPERRSGSHWRADLYQRVISRVAAILQRSTMPNRAERQAPSGASHAANSYACACPCGFLFQ